MKANGGTKCERNEKRKVGFACDYLSLTVVGQQPQQLKKQVSLDTYFSPRKT